MKYIIKFTLSALVAVFLVLTASSCREKNDSGGGTAQGKPSASNTTGQAEKTESGPAIGNSVVHVQYFYSESHRCPSCMKIESYTTEAINGTFNQELQSGKLKFLLVDMDKAENKPAMKKYKLFTKSVVVSEFSGEEEVSWQNLDEVWKLLGNESAFKEYIVKEVKSYL